MRCCRSISALLWTATEDGQKKEVARYKGHIEGAKTFRKIGEFAGDLGIKYLTFYAFSTENWKRPKEEVSAIMNLFREYLKELDERKAENEERYSGEFHRRQDGTS